VDTATFSFHLSLSLNPYKLSKPAFILPLNNTMLTQPPTLPDNPMSKKQILCRRRHFPSNVVAVAVVIVVQRP
jgi:hypothetical protein